MDVDVVALVQRVQHGVAEDALADGVGVEVVRRVQVRHRHAAHRHRRVEDKSAAGL